MLERIAVASVWRWVCSVAVPDIYRCHLFVDKVTAGTSKGSRTARLLGNARTNGSMLYTRRCPHRH